MNKYRNNNKDRKQICSELVGLENAVLGQVVQWRFGVQPAREATRESIRYIVTRNCHIRVVSLLIFQTFFYVNWDSAWNNGRDISRNSSGSTCRWPSSQWPGKPWPWRSRGWCRVQNGQDGALFHFKFYVVRWIGGGEERKQKYRYLVLNWQEGGLLIFISFLTINGIPAT